MHRWFAILPLLASTAAPALAGPVSRYGDDTAPPNPFASNYPSAAPSRLDAAEPAIRRGARSRRPAVEDADGLRPPADIPQR